jgi:hypothetical protein
VAHILARIDGRQIGRLDGSSSSEQNRRSVSSGPIELPASTDPA